VAGLVTTGIVGQPGYRALNFQDAADVIAQLRGVPSMSVQTIERRSS
jgi:hypothetical protein